MKKSELIQIIREEIQKLNEVDAKNSPFQESTITETWTDYDEWRNTRIQAKNIFRMLRQKYKNAVPEMKAGLETILKQNKTKPDQAEIVWQEFNKYFKIKENAQPLKEEKKVTRATIKAMMKKLKVPEDKYELSMDDVTIWFSDIPEKKAKKIMKIMQDSFGGTIKGNGSWYALQYKGTSLDMGDWNDASSRWHY